MKREELVALQNKVDEVRAVLLFGKRSLPFLEDIFAFVQDIIPVVEELKVSVDATSDKLPKASKQLDKVTHATEIASTEILNTLEGMFAKLEGLTVRYNEQQSQVKHIAETIHGVDAALDALDVETARPEHLAQLREAWGRQRALLRFPEDGILESLTALQNDCTNIMMALQVQDITAQQIASVNRLMQSVDEGLNKLMKHFAEVPATAVPGRYNHAHLDIQFDDAADFFGSENRQKAADELVESAAASKGYRTKRQQPIQIVSGAYVMEHQDIPSGNGKNPGTAESRDLLKEFIAVVHDVIPMLDQMKSSIHESSHKIPMASRQLSSVAQATETATVEILNVLDSMTQGITESEAILTDLAEQQTDLQTIGSELTRGLQEIAMQQPSAPGLIEVQKLWSEYAQRTSHADALAKANTALAGVRSHTMSIAMVLQVQDITAQQIAGVIHLIESVRAQLTQVLANLERNAKGGVDWKAGDCSPASSDQAFDSDAQYVRGPERQEMADNIINEWGNAARHNPE